MDTIDPFLEVTTEKDMETTFNILTTRLPRSAHMYNMALMLKTVDLDIKVYTLKGDFSSDCWILFVLRRVDYGRDISISTPINPIVTEEIKRAFISSKVFDWSSKYFFNATDISIAPMLAEISAAKKGNATSFNPFYYYYMDTTQASGFNIELPNGFDLNHLKSKVGAEFLVNNWKYSGEHTLENTQRALEKCDSAGIFKNNIPVSGIILNMNGFMGMLHTSKSHRGNGLAQLCMKILAKRVAGNGMVPTSICEQKNSVSNIFHEKIGMKVSHLCACVYYSGTGW